MNATTLAQNAYSLSTATVRTDRGTEYDIFARVTLGLKKFSNTNNYPGLIAALHENRQYWTLLAVDVADSDNGLSPALRAQIFYLAEFTILHTSKVLSGDATVEALVDINTSVMRGLSQQGGPK